MTAKSSCWLFAALALCPLAAVAGSASAETPPKSLDPRIEIRLFAEAPQIVTPTGVAVDHRGRVWAIESNTHHRQPSYKGYPSDRVLVFRDADGDGRADHIETFADGFTHAMSIAVPFGDAVYVATRKDVFRLTDADGDGRADGRRAILRLETLEDYPHNGLAGLAVDGLGYMYIGLGENRGAAYRLVGTDGRSHSGGGEGGSVFRFRPDGTDLTLWATGFWNPHASCVDAFGRMFTVDNDPDDRPPCRLLALIPGGDYGYRFRNGRRGIHPFTAWDGELPGTLPMAAGTGEAPCAVIPYESDALPDEYRGNLLASSWGDHRVDRFRLHPRGTSLATRAEPLIVGGENFRPVGLALAPDGSIYATDWVLKDYNVHGKGRIWRISAKLSPRRPVDDLAAVPSLPIAELRKKLDSPRMDVRRLAAQTLAHRDNPFLSGIARDDKSPIRARIEATWALAGDLRSAFPHSPAQSSLKNAELPLLWTDFADADSQITASVLLRRLKRPSVLNPSRELVRLVERLPKLVRSEPGFLEKAVDLDDRFVFAAVCQALTGIFRLPELAQRLRPERTPSPRVRLVLLLAARRAGSGTACAPVLSAALADPDFAVRRTAVQWIGEEHLQQFRGDVERQLADSTTTADLFEAALASLEMLDGMKRASKNEISGADYALRLARDEKAAGPLRARALRIVPPDQKGLTANMLKRMMAAADPALRYEAIRTLRETTFAETPAILRSVAADERSPAEIRLEAIAGLAAVLERDEHDRATIDVLRRLLSGRDERLQIAALRALKRSLRIAEVGSAAAALARTLATTAPANSDDRRLADQLAVALATSGLAVPQEIRQSETLRPHSIEDWQRLASSGGDPEAGRRLFEHPNAGSCIHCHTVNGRGGKIGPDLSVVARAASREKLADSILQPSREIAPQFTSWTFVTRQGRTLTGLVLADSPEGLIRIGTAEGKVVEIAPADVEERRPQKKSVMPDKLVDSLTVDEFRDLVAFLASLK